jgi:hypothetical protein
MTVLDLRRASYRQQELLAMFDGDLVPLGTSEANVRVIRHRAIQHLRVCMGATP